MLLGEAYDFQCWIINKSKLALSNTMRVYVYVSVNDLENKELRKVN